MRLGWKQGLWLVCIGPAVLNALLYYAESRVLIPVLIATMTLVLLVMYRAVGSIRKLGWVFLGGAAGCVIGLALGYLIATTVIAGRADPPSDAAVTMENTGYFDWVSEIVGSALIIYLSAGFFLGCWCVTFLLNSDKGQFLGSGS